MDVSRIDAYRPQIYDWRNMTAKEIIKHDDDGDKVPAMYLQWAKEFLNSVYSDDVTTYEVAISRKKGVSEQKEETKKVSSMQGGDSVEPGEEPQLTAAQADRMSMIDSGADIITQAKEFRKKSNSLSSDSFNAQAYLSALKDDSNSEMWKLTLSMLILDNKMEDIFRNLQSIKALNNINNSNDNADSIVEQAYKKGEQLKKEALEGHRQISKTENNLDIIGTNMSGYVPTFESAQDYGGVTVNIGNEISVNDFILALLRSSVIKSGNNAIKNGKSGIKFEEQAQNKNAENLSDSGKYHDVITNKSGIESPQKTNKKNKNDGLDLQTKDLTTESIDKNKKEDIKKEDKDLPTDRETIVKLEDEDKSAKGNFVKNASKMTTVQDAPSNKEFADDNQKIQTANEFERAKENDGADERTVTMALRADSITADNAALGNMGQAQIIAQASQTAYNELDQNIQDLMNEINSTEQEIKNEISRVNSGIATDGISRINQLNAELREYGISALSMAGGTEGIINSYAGELDNIGGSFSDAMAKGLAAIAGGEAIIANSEDRWLAFKLVNEIIGKNAITVGSITEQDGIKGIAEKSKASSVVNANLLNITTLKSEIQSKTGVESTSAKARNNNVNNNEEAKKDLIIEEETSKDITKPNLEKPKEKVKNSEKAVKIAQNDGTDTNDKQNTDINAIIARKVRRGEVNMG